MKAVQVESSIMEDGRNDASLNFTLEVKVYRRRWLQLILLFILNISNFVHWFQFTIITSVIRRYYNVSSLAVESTYVMFMVAYVTLILPASYLTNKIGLRWTCLLITSLTTLGSWIKVFSIFPDRFIVACMGQLVIAVTIVFIMTVPGSMVAFWFRPEETGVATTIIVVGQTTGVLACFLTASIVFTNHDSIEDIGNDLSRVFWAVAIGSTFVTVAIFVLFQDQPDLPPSKARALVLNSHQKTNFKVFWRQVREVLRNRNFLIFCNSSGFIVSALNALITFINSFYVTRFKDSETDAGILAFLYIIVGNVSGVMYGIILDKTKAFRAVPSVITGVTVVMYILFATSLMNEVKWMVFVTFLCLGSCGSGYILNATEVCVEMTYPQPESAAVGIMYLSHQAYGIVIVLVTGRILESFGDIAVHASLFAYLTLGSLLTIFNRFEFRRHNAALIAAKYNSVRCEISTPLDK